MLKKYFQKRVKAIKNNGIFPMAKASVSIFCTLKKKCLYRYLLLRDGGEDSLQRPLVEVGGGERLGHQRVRDGGHALQRRVHAEESCGMVDGAGPHARHEAGRVQLEEVGALPPLLLLLVLLLLFQVLPTNKQKLVTKKAHESVCGLVEELIKI